VSTKLAPADESLPGNPDGQTYKCFGTQDLTHTLHIELDGIALFLYSFLQANA
jgi:hypothetical protein